MSHYLPGPLHQKGKDVESAAAERDRNPKSSQRPVGKVEAERAKREGPETFGFKGKPTHWLAGVLHDHLRDRLPAWPFDGANRPPQADIAHKPSRLPLRAASPNLEKYLLTVRKAGVHGPPGGHVGDRRRQ